MNNDRLTVIDFFCGAGGFSEGFKQMGFDIKYGYDHWKPAVDTFNHNFNLECEVKNILDFKTSIEEIENLPDTDIIIGSPPCVSFSSSNKSGNADKSLGVELTETFLRIVAVKKHKPNSILKAWFMENVVNSRRYLQTAYTFRDLGLTEWAKKHRISPIKVAIDLFENTTVINSADYGSIQSRKRVISGEIVKNKKLIVPTVTHQKKEIDKHLPLYNSISKIKNSFPSPFQKKNKKIIRDIQYPIEIEQDKITDHFYDTGVYEAEWRFSRHWKTNHPFMGKMSFPENENNPSRTITATKIANSRESIIYKSEINRKGDGEYRLPTVREAAIIMGFPITYQFIGSENTKWRLVGNAVCTSVSRAFAGTVLNFLGIEQEEIIVERIPKLKGVLNLNDYKIKTLDNPPIKNKNARCRWQPIKEGNLTVTLSNYDIEKNKKSDGKWRTSVQYGTGKGFPIQHIEDGYFNKLESIVKKFKEGQKFIEVINNGFSEKIGDAQKLQDMFETQKSIDNFLEPTRLVDEVRNIIQKTVINEPEFIQIDTTIFLKKRVPTRQLFALYAINKISTTANQKSHD